MHGAAAAGVGRLEFFAAGVFRYFAVRSGFGQAIRATFGSERQTLVVAVVEVCKTGLSSHSPVSEVAKL